jgi:hypothetical protein
MYTTRASENLKRSVINNTTIDIEGKSVTTLVGKFQ